MPNEDILHETTTELPASFVIKKGSGGRYQLIVIKDKGGNFVDDCLNFYDGEQLYLHVDQGWLTYIVAKSQQEPAKIKRRLKRLIWAAKYVFSGKIPEES